MGLYNYTIDDSIRIEFYYDRMSYLVAYLYIKNTDDVKVEIYANLADMSAPEMCEIWKKLKIDVLPPNFMEDIRVSVLVHLQDVNRADLVAVCLDSAAPSGETMRL